MSPGSVNRPIAGDLEHILKHTGGLWEEFRGRRIFVTGGTGFFGKWILESFAWANNRLGLGARALVLTRDPEKFLAANPHFSTEPSISFCTGDVRTFEFPGGDFSHVIHAATESSVSLNTEEPLTMFDTIVAGTRRTLEFARRSGAAKFLLTSSGAVYGKQPPDVTHTPESAGYGPDPLDPASAYGEGKRTAELLCAIWCKRYGIGTKIARGFAFVGPYLNLDIHFAIGNFIRDGLRGGPIIVKGDGTPYRSYLYAADLIVWLWTILVRGEACRPYNVGSEEAMTIGELAHAVAGEFDPPVPVTVMQAPHPGEKPDRYIPSTRRAEQELHLRQHIPTHEAIRRTIQWHRQIAGRVAEDVV